MEIEKLLKHFKKTPGLDLAVATMTGLMVPFIIGRNVMEEWGLLIIPLVWACAYVLSSISGVLDKSVFDPLYGSWEQRTKRFSPYWWFMHIIFLVTWVIDSFPITKGLDGKRIAAFKKLKLQPLNHPPPKNVEGLYKSAAKIFSGREEWEKKVQSRLEYSKAARVFIFPALVQLCWVILHLSFGWPSYVILNAENPLIKWLVWALQNPLAMYLVFQLPAFVYLYLRIAHMNNLYCLVIDAEVFKFEVEGEGSCGSKPREMLSVGSVVIPKCALEMYEDECPD